MPTTYADSGVDYSLIKAFKESARALSKISINNSPIKYQIIKDLLGTSCFGIKSDLNNLGPTYFTVEEQLGTKSLVALDCYKELGAIVYYNIAYDTVASIVNDVICGGGQPLVISMNIASGYADFFCDTEASMNFLNGWAQACEDSGAIMGHGETSVLSGVICEGALFVGGSAIAVSPSPDKIITGKKIRTADEIICLSSNGIHANGVSLVRKLASERESLYNFQIGQETFGSKILYPSNIYSALIQELITNGIQINYISHITGHGFEKVMRYNGEEKFHYKMKQSWKTQSEFHLIKKLAHLSDQEMYNTFNMGVGMVLIVPAGSFENIKNYEMNHPDISITHGGVVEMSEVDKVTIEGIGVEFIKA